MARQARCAKPNNFNCQLYATYPDTISYAAKVTGIDTAYIGPFAARRVMNGDSITLKVESYYRTHDNNASLQPALTAAQSNAALLKQVAAGLVQNGQGSTYAELLADTTLQNSVTNYLAGISATSGRPQAGVYYISLDQQLHYIAAGSGFAQVGSGGCGVINPVIPKATTNGYMFVLVGNQTQQLFVYYDNLQMQHVHSPVLEEASYYPFGLAMAGISSKASGSLINRYKFNGGNELQSGEFSDGSGLEMYDAKNRLYDPQAPHFWQQDPLANINFGQSPYNFCDNNPIRFNDPWGLSKQGFGFEDDTKPDEGLQGVTVTPHGNKQTDNTLGYYQAAGMADKAMARGINIDNVDLRRFGYDDRQRLHYMFSDARKKHDAIYNDRSMENVFYGVLAAPVLLEFLGASGAGQFVVNKFRAELSTRLISTAGDLSVQYVSNIRSHGAGLENFRNINLTSLGASFLAPNASFTSSAIANGFSYNLANGYTGLSINGNNWNTASNIAIGWAGNLVGGHISENYLSPSLQGQFKGNIFGNITATGVGFIKDTYVNLNQ